VPSVAIPYGQRFINVDLASASELVGYQLRGSGLDANTSLSSPNISQMYLYINNIFVNPEIHKIYIKRIGFTLIRVHRYQNISTSSPSQEFLLNALKWPVEALFVGMRLASQKTSLADWHKFTKTTPTQFNMPNLITNDTTATVDTTSASPSVSKPVIFSFNQAKCTGKVETPTLDRVTISAHGINLYNDLPAGFFNYYTPYTFGGANIRAPEDKGVLMIPFNLYPGTYQPSGHVNISRAREFYINYSSSVIGTSSPPIAGELVVVASAINFLLINHLLVSNRQLPCKLDLNLTRTNSVIDLPLIQMEYNCLVPITA
jgi:hypothetical protein